MHKKTHLWGRLRTFNIYPRWGRVSFDIQRLIRRFFTPFLSINTSLNYKGSISKYVPIMQLLFVININGIQSNTIVQLLMESEVGRQENLFLLQQKKGKLSTQVGTETDILPKERMEKGVQRKLYVRNRNENWRLLCIATEVSNTMQKLLRAKLRSPRKVKKLLIEELLARLQLK